MIFIILSTVVQIVILVYFYVSFKRKYKMWKMQQVPNLPATFPLGNLDFTVMSSNFVFIVQKWYDKFKSNANNLDYGGLYFLNRPVLLVLSPQFAKTILIKDFQYFVNRGVYFDKDGDPLSSNLFFIEGNDWKSLRPKITPKFSSVKIRSVFEGLRTIGDKLIDRLGQEQSFDCVDITEFLFRFNTDVIGSCAFGMDCNTLQDKNSEFRDIGKKMLQFSRIRLFKLYVAMLFREEARMMGFRLVDADVSTFITKVVRDTIAFRKANNIKRNDILQLLIDLMEEDKSEQNSIQFSVNDIAANVFVFFFAGFETSTTAMAYALYELSLHQNIQERLRNEIDEMYAKYSGQITYEAVMEMSYLDKVINETMRKNPAVGTLHRVCNEDYQLSTGAIIPKGTFVIIPALAFHRDPDLFANPNQFDPERFSEENKSLIQPCSFLPFGEGPRICIGLRFGQLQMKLGLALLLRNFKFDVCNETEIPLRIDDVSLLHVPKHGIRLKMEKIKRN